MNATQANSFGDLLRQHRVAAGLTQEMLAERARMSVAAISKLERGSRQRPYRATLGLLADALSLSADDRLGLELAAQRSESAVSNSAQRTQAAINLPVQLSSFVGRERDLEKVHALLTAHRLITLVGAGGVGKTRLAIRAAEDFIAAVPVSSPLDGVWFVDLSTVSDVDTTMSVIALSVGIQPCRSLDTLITYLRSQRSLLILDNCEHLIGEVTRLTNELLRGCPRMKILATSREALGVDGERIYRVPPLTVPATEAHGPLSVGDALKFDAVRLFVERAEAADSRFELTASTITGVAQICGRLDGIALAIELAAARTNAFSPATIAEWLDKHLLGMTSGHYAPDSRHRTMEAVFDWSYHLLNDYERTAFRRLSIFVGGFSFDLAAAVWAREIDASLAAETLASLVEKSLVQCDPYVTPARYKMLEPARQYARERLTEHDEQSAAVRSHANALLALAEAFDARLKLTPDDEWDAYIAAERDNFRAALDWALGRNGDTSLGQRLAGSLTAIWCGFASGDVPRWVNAALKTTSDATPVEVQSRLALMALYSSVNFEHDARAMLSLGQRALSLQQSGDLRGQSTAKQFIGAALRHLKQFDEAQIAFREAIALARTCGAQDEYVWPTILLGTLHQNIGDLNEARALISEALQLERASGAYRRAAITSLSLAEVEFEAGDVQQAIRLTEDTLVLGLARNNKSVVAMAHCNICAYLISAGRYDEARNHAGEGLRCASAIGRLRTLRESMQHCAALAILRDTSRRNEPALRRAASLLGFVDERLREGAYSRDNTEQQEYDKILPALRDVLGESELAKVMATGKDWSEDRAMAEALAL